MFYFGRNYKSNDKGNATTEQFPSQMYVQLFLYILWYDYVIVDNLSQYNM